MWAYCSATRNRHPASDPTARHGGTARGPDVPPHTARARGSRASSHGSAQSGGSCAAPPSSRPSPFRSSGTGGGSFTSSGMSSLGGGSRGTGPGESGSWPCDASRWRCACPSDALANAVRGSVRLPALPDVLSVFVGMAGHRSSFVLRLPVRPGRMRRPGQRRVGARSSHRRPEPAPGSSAPASHRPSASGFLEEETAVASRPRRDLTVSLLDSRPPPSRRTMDSGELRPAGR